jgi:hypothetical protein
MQAVGFRCRRRSLNDVTTISVDELTNLQLKPNFNLPNLKSQLQESCRVFLYDWGWSLRLESLPYMARDELLPLFPSAMSSLEENIPAI